MLQDYFPQFFLSGHGMMQPICAKIGVKHQPTNLQLKDRNNGKTGERILCWKLEPASSEKDVVRGVGTDEAVGDAG